MTRLLLAYPVLVAAYVAALHARIVPARPDDVWPFLAPPIAALLVGPRSRRNVTLAIVELASVLALHAFVTLLRAARLEGG